MLAKQGANERDEVQETPMSRSIQKLHRGILFLGGCIAIALTSLPIAAQQCAALPPGAIAWYRAERNADDSVGFFNAELYQGASYAVGQVGEAFHLDGVDDQIYGDVVTGAEQRAVRSAFTYEMWARPSRTLGTCAQGAGSNCSGNNLAWAIFPTHGDNSGPPQENGLAAGVGVAIGTDGVCAGSHATNLVDCLARVNMPIASSVFTHIAVVVENKTPRIYVNGVLAHTGVPSNKSFVFASWELLGFTSLGSFGGELDEVTIYGRALSDAEIAAQFAAGSAGKCPSGCVFNERHDDAWEGATVLSNTGLRSSDASGMFGGATSFPEATTTIFADNQPDGTVHAIEWSAPEAVTLRGLHVMALHDSPNDTQRGFRHLRVQAREVGGNFATVFDSNVVLPYAPGSRELNRCIALRPVHAKEFRAEFTQAGAPGFSGPRVVELDAGGTIDLFRDGFEASP